MSIESVSRPAPVPKAAPQPASSPVLRQTKQSPALSTDRIERPVSNGAAVVGQRGFGVGLLVGASLEAGAIVGAGGTASAGAGFFYNGARGVQPGAFAAGGAFAGIGHAGVKVPQSSNAAGAVGVFAGAGIGAFVTNASSAQQLGGAAQTCSVNVGVGPLKVSGEISGSDGTYVASVSVGPGLGVDASCFATKTVAGSR